MITGKHIRAARGALGLSHPDLAKKAGVSLTTISRFERGAARTTVDAAGKMQRALEAEGIEFLFGDRPGIRWRD